MERLQKVIANSGLVSRRKAEELIKEEKIKIDDKIITSLGTKVSSNQIILVNNKPLDTVKKVYYLLNKPRGVVTTSSDDKGRTTVVDLINTNIRIYPVGRLDYDTTGLLLLTNDGDFTNYMTHPKNEIDKVYVAKVKGNLDIKAIMSLKNGVMLDGVKTSKAKVKVRKYDKESNISIVEITIHEGKNHQVKRMFNAVGCDVVKLKRERVAFLDLTGLKSGEYRELSIKEVKKLYDIANN